MHGSISHSEGAQNEPVEKKKKKASSLLLTGARSNERLLCVFRALE